MTIETYNPNVHVEAARNVQLERIFGGHDLFLVGSLARAAAIGAETPGVCKSFTGGVRDIDVTYGQEEGVALSNEETTPFPVDVALDGLLKIRPGETYSRVLFDNRRPDVSVELPSEVFEPYPVRISGQPVNTFHPDTLRRLHLIRGTGRLKDTVNIIRFQSALRDVDYTPLPDECFEPLEELRNMVNNDPKLKIQQRVERLQGIYAMVPFSVRQYTTPGLRRIKRRFVPTERNPFNMDNR